MLSAQSRCPRNLLFWRARGAEEVTVQARGLQEEVVTRDIWLPGFYCCSVCVCERQPSESRHVLSIKKKEPNNRCQAATRAYTIYFRQAAAAALRTDVTNRWDHFNDHVIVCSFVLLIVKST